MLSPERHLHSAAPMRDITIENHGSIVLVRPHTDAATDWLHQNVQEGAQWFGSALVVEPCYVAPLIVGMSDQGFTVV